MLEGCQYYPNFQIHGNIPNACATRIGRTSNPLACLYEIAHMLAEPWYYKDVTFFARQFQFILMGTTWTTYDMLDAIRRLAGVSALAA